MTFSAATPSPVVGRNTGDAPPGGIAADYNTVANAVLELRAAGLAKAADIATDPAVTGKAPKMVPTTVQQDDYTANPQEWVLVDTTTGPSAVFLPAAPADGTSVRVKKVDASPNAVTITAGGTDRFNRVGGNTSLSVSQQNQSMALQYQAATGLWLAQDSLSLTSLLTYLTANFAQKFTQVIGDGTTRVFVIAHNKGSAASADVVVKEVSSGARRRPQIDDTDANTVTLTFQTAPATNSLLVTVT